MFDPYESVQGRSITELVRKGRAGAAQYLRNAEEVFGKKVLEALGQGSRPLVTVWVGPGRSGKDYGAEKFYEGLYQAGKPAGYGGSCSWAILPVFCAALETEDSQSVWSLRHNHRQFWREFCDEFRRPDQTALARLCLAQGDCIVGIRSLPEFNAVRAMSSISTLAIWVERKGIPVDPTLEITEDECDLTLKNDRDVDGNGGLLYEARVRTLRNLAFPKAKGFFG